jgi:hypothetical protein
MMKEIENTINKERQTLLTSNISENHSEKANFRLQDSAVNHIDKDLINQQMAEMSRLADIQQRQQREVVNEIIFIYLFGCLFIYMLVCSNYVRLNV